MNIRKLALEAIEKILASKAYSNLAVSEYLTKYELSATDKALFSKIVYGTIQNLLTLEYYLDPYIGHKKQKPWVKYLLYLSVYQLYYLHIPEYAVVNEAVDIANVKDRAVGSFVNAVLHNVLRNERRSFQGLDEITYLSVRYSYPAWLISYILKDYDYETTENILKEYSEPKEEAIRINTLKTDKETVKSVLERDGIRYREISFVQNGMNVDTAIQNHKLFQEGLVTIQDASAQRVAEIVSPERGDAVLDVCSAPGGKAAHLSSLMENTGTIHACDIHPHKIRLMENLFQRLGVTNVKCQLVDARHLSDLVRAETFDKILADVPCSGIGVLSHKPDLKYHISLEGISEIRDLQKEIIDSTWELVKKGGFYIYSTCTINKEENEQQMEEFLRTHPDAEKIQEETILPLQYHSDGFYICKIRRKTT